MISVIISLGSNCGDRRGAVEGALDWLKTILMQTKCSKIYETPCALKEGKPYLNAVIKGFFDGDAFQLTDLLKEKEHEMGRKSSCHKKGNSGVSNPLQIDESADVPIDIDLVVCDNEVMKPWDFRQKFFRIGYEEISPGSNPIEI